MTTAILETSGAMAMATAANKSWCHGKGAGHGIISRRDKSHHPR